MRKSRGTQPIALETTVPMSSCSGTKQRELGTVSRTRAGHGATPGQALRAPGRRVVQGWVRCLKEKMRATMTDQHRKWELRQKQTESTVATR